MTAELVVYTRTGCHLCDDMLDRLGQLGEEYGFQYGVIDVDQDRELVQKYGLKVPVLEANGEEICHFFLDERQLLKKLDLD